MPTLEDSLPCAGAAEADDRWDRELDQVEWIELPDGELAVEPLVWAVLAGIAGCVLAAIL